MSYMTDAQVEFEKDLLAAECELRSGVGRAKTHCPSGHPYAGDNLIVFGGSRMCRTCAKRHKQNYKIKKAKR